MEPFLAVAVAVAILLVVVGAVFFVGPQRRPARRASEPPTSARSGLGEEPESADTTTSRGVQTVALPDDTLVEPTAPAFERPEAPGGRLVRLRARLSRSQSSLGRGLLALLTRDRIDEDTWEEIEEVLLTSDLGVAPSQQLVERLRTRVRVEGLESAQAARAVLREELLAVVDPTLDRSLDVSRRGGKPAIILVVGVNGTGKTTTVGKLARMLVAQDKDVVLGAADTFRAAAADQLQTWGERVGVPTVRGPEGGDPASVAFEATRAGIEQEADVVVIDTAGRLHTKTGLMDELGKVKRVVERQAPVTEVLLVLDATTGQNGLAQAQAFLDAVDVTGVVLTKLDGTAKGGIVIAIQRQTGIPVKLVGLGETIDDLADFDPDAFVEALFDDGAQDVEPPKPDNPDDQE